MNENMPIERIETKIFLIRGQKVMIDRDLAELYGVSTKRLNEQVKRNISRFPADFMFILTLKEKRKVVAICDHLKDLKYSYQLPLAFTEQGVAMLSSILKSEKAVQVNIAIMRAFVKLRQVLATHKELAHKFKELEGRVGKHDVQITAIFDAIRQMMAVPEKPKRRIGFIADRQI
ncbi:MAG: ORF6N domain-containing protein [Candidatus Margulisiibacteriota bacterium]